MIRKQSDIEKFVNSLSWTSIGCIVLVIAAWFIYVTQQRREKESNSIVIYEWPGLRQVVSGAIWSILFKPRKLKSLSAIEASEVYLERRCSWSLHRISRFLRLTQQGSGVGGGPVGGGTEIPVMYPIVEAFRVVLALMFQPTFPVSVVGSVLVRSTSMLLRPAQIGDAMHFRSRLDPNFRRTPKGDTEFDIVSAATSLHDGMEFWRNTLTVVVLSPDRDKKSMPAPAVTPGTEMYKLLDTFNLESNVGRRYGILSGDLNPVHLWSWTSRLFGYRSPIAHALMLMAYAEASIRKKGIKVLYPAVVEAEFKRPTLLPATLQMTWDQPVLNSMAMVSGINWAIKTDRLDKDVMVGRFYQDPSQVMVKAMRTLEDDVEENTNPDHDD